MSDLSPSAETINLHGLLDYAEKLFGRAVSKNAVNNALERGKVASCGQVKVERTWCNVYPRAQSKEAIERWAADKTK